MLFHLLSGHIGKVVSVYIFKQTFFVTVQVTDKIGQPQRERIPFISRGQVTVDINKSLPVHFLLRVDFILRSFYAL